MPSIWRCSPIFVALAACGGPSSDSSAQHSGIAQNQFLDAYVHAACDGLEACCKPLGISASSCLAARRDDYANALMWDVDPSHRYDAVLAAACVEEVRARTAATAATCAVPPAAAGVSGFGSPCGHFIVGTVAPGGPCTSVIDCAPSADGPTACLPVGSASQCRVMVTGKPGDACAAVLGAMTSVYCSRVDGLYCDGTVCAPLVAPGGATQMPSACGPHSEWDNGVCVAATVNVGDPCTASGVCDGLCDAQGVCRSLSVAVLPIACGG